VQLFANNDELKALQVYDSELPLCNVGVHGLRKQTGYFGNIRLKLELEHLGQPATHTLHGTPRPFFAKRPGRRRTGLFAHVLTSPKRLVALIPNDTSVAGGVAW